VLLVDCSSVSFFLIDLFSSIIDRHFFAKFFSIIVLSKNKFLSVGILAKMKESAENVHTKLQAKAESVGLKPSTFDGKG